MITALVVEDDRVCRELFRKAMERAGFRCDSAASAEEASVMCSRTSYDVVLTDLGMPGRGGRALCAELLARSPRPAVAVLSGLPDPTVEADLRQRGLDAYFCKPISLRDISSALSALAMEAQGR